jgi:hypothetical protein
LDKPIAVLRRDIMATTGPSIMGLKRMDKVSSSKGEIFTFLGVAEGVAYLERDDKSAGDPFLEVESEILSKWKRI